MSYSKKALGINLMVLSSICACVGQLYWKLSADGNLFFLLLGFLLYIAGAIFMIVAYRYGKLSVLQPILSLNYVLTILLGVYVLGEKMSFQNILGILVIIMGVLFIVKSE